MRGNSRGGLKLRAISDSQRNRKERETTATTSTERDRAMAKPKPLTELTDAELWQVHRRAANRYNQVVNEHQRRDMIRRYGTTTPEGLRDYEVSLSIGCDLLVKATSPEDAEQIASDVYATSENDQIDFVDSGYSVESVELYNEQPEAEATE